jgi:hypothetical protein
LVVAYRWDKVLFEAAAAAAGLLDVMGKGH